MTKPLQSLITTPIPDFLSYGKTKPSKFILKNSDGGGLHWHLLWRGCRTCVTGTTCLALNSSNQTLDSWAIWWSASTGWLRRTRFRWSQMDQTVTTNNSCWSLFNQRTELNHGNQTLSGIVILLNKKRNILWKNYVAYCYFLLLVGKKVISLINSNWKLVITCQLYCKNIVKIL